MKNNQNINFSDNQKAQTFQKGNLQKGQLKEKEKQFDLKQNLLNNEISLSPFGENQINLCSYFHTKLSEQALLNYGTSYLKLFIAKSKQNILPEDFMQNHSVSPLIRAKMVNWMIEVFYNFHSNEETFLSAVDIMDKFLYFYKKKIIKDEDIHLIGIVCIYISSKFYDLYPINIDNIIHQIGHDKFSTKEILKMEKIIIKTINFEMFYNCGFDLIRFFIYDFYINNKSTFNILKCHQYVDMLTNTSIWIYKMCKHFEQYSSSNPLTLAISCLLIGYDLIKDNCNRFNGKIKNFFKKWLTFLYNKIGKNKENKEKIEIEYKMIQNSYDEYKKAEFKNLSIYHELYFE